MATLLFPGVQLSQFLLCWHSNQPWSVLILTFNLCPILGQFLSADQHREWIVSVIGWVNFPDFDCIINKIVMQDLWIEVNDGLVVLVLLRPCKGGYPCPPSEFQSLVVVILEGSHVVGISTSHHLIALVWLFRGHVACQNLPLTGPCYWAVR